MEVLNDQPMNALHVEGSSMSGIGIDPEGIDNNPVSVSLKSDGSAEEQTLTPR